MGLSENVKARLKLADLHIHEKIKLRRMLKKSLRLLVVFSNKLIFYGELLAPRPTPKLEDHPLSAVRDCLFNIFAPTLQNWRGSPPSAT
jgi:hypothetical protein